MNPVLFKSVFIIFGKSNIMKSDKTEIEKRFTQFARQYISGRTDLNHESVFPHDLWRDMATNRLFGIGIPEARGGLGGNGQVLSAAGRALTEAGGNLGVALSWLIHELTSRYLILKFGSPEQIETWLPKLADGSQTACMAVSEPETGPHPKYIKTAAVADGDAFVISGRKTYLTNGPLAGLFIVVAVTETIAGKNRFSAFIIPEDTPGLTASDPMNLPFLRPSPHCGITLDNCRVAKAQILGEPGAAYETMVVPFRETEDILMMGLMCGAMGFLYRRLTEFFEKQGISRTEELVEAAGDLYAAIAGLNIIAKKGAELLDENAPPSDRTALSLYFRKQVQDFLTRINWMVSEAAITNEESFLQMITDLSGAIRIGQSAIQNQRHKLGSSIFKMT